MIPQDNMKQRMVGTDGKPQYAVFLPALSSFYTFQICSPSKKMNPNRIPASLQHGARGLDFLEPNNSYFYYPWCLYSAGHAILTLGQEEKEDMVRLRDPNSLIVGDSGGFQIGKGVWEGDWKDPTCTKAQAKRDGVLRWMDEYMNYGMCLDVPAWVCKTAKGREKSGINSYQEAVMASRINNDYWMKHRTGKCKFLNVLQGSNHTEADDWYSQMKDYSDHRKYPGTHFNGWAFGGQNTSDIHLILHRLVAMIRDGLLEKGYQDWLHVLGTSKLEWAVLLTDLQRSVRKHHNENFTISFDCASPFLANAKGLVYDEIRIAHEGKWTYSMNAGLDDKKYATDSRLYGDVARNDGVIPNFQDSHLSKYYEVRDICCYKPGDLNLIGKEGKTSWDTFSYALQMGHNTWMHCNAVLTANEQYDKGVIPSMLMQRNTLNVFRDIAEEIIANAGNQKSTDLINEFNRFWIDIKGQHGFTGKKTVNATTNFNKNFTMEYVTEIEEEKKKEPLKVHHTADKFLKW